MILRVATWNVEYAADAGRNARRLELLHAADADIVVLTETHDNLRLDGYEATSTLQRPGARAGARWTTIWSRLAVRRVIDTQEPLRTVAVELEGDLLVYGTVLPWHSDPGPSDRKKVNWSEYRRVVPIQGAEWLALRKQHPEHTLMVVGDFNQSLGERHYYGGQELRRLLEQMCAAAGVEVFTGLAHQQVPLAHPLIDHVAVAPAQGHRTHLNQLTGWEGAWEGPGRLSDHSAVVVEVQLEKELSGTAPSP
jgi:endonuclease/exonuclease/phosphatase family metal-dependent hydrolase